jgi:hypothetical protein
VVQWQWEERPGEAVRVEGLRLSGRDIPGVSAPDKKKTDGWSGQHPGTKRLGPQGEAQGQGSCFPKDLLRDACVQLVSEGIGPALYLFPGL